LITASISSYTYRNGATDLKIPEETLFQYIEQLVYPELVEDDFENLPLLKATCIKFVYMFRNQIPDEHVHGYLGVFVKFLQSMSIVNQSYAAACIEKLLTKKRRNSDESLFTSANIDQSIVQSLLQYLCTLLNEQKNLYAMRALFRVVSLSQAAM
jgi:hypothetical protein